VRNAVGHGIETAEERVRAGKRPQGTLRSRLSPGNQWSSKFPTTEPALIRKKSGSARIPGLLPAEQAARLTEAETLHLILQPGFSTANEVTELSGRAWDWTWLKACSCV